MIAGGSDSTSVVWDALCGDSFLECEPPGDGVLARLAGLDAGDASILGRHQLLALAVLEKAWGVAGLPAGRNRLRGEGVKTRHARIGCVAGTSSGNLVALELEGGGEAKIPPYAITRWRGNSIGAAATLRFGLGGCDFSINAASGTGAQAVFLGGTLIRHGLADAVVVVAADPVPAPRLLRAMESNRSVGRGRPARPLESGRSGMTPAEGAACLVLESAEHAAARGAKVVAEWTGGETGNEAHHLLAPEPGARVLGELFGRLIRDGRPPDWISLHATGTPRFDLAEVRCVKRLFGEMPPWISAIKRTTGHALGASGLIEACLIVEGLRLGKVPGWPAGTDPALGLSPSAAAPVPRTAWQIGQGMGGVVAVNSFAAVDSVP